MSSQQLVTLQAVKYLPVTPGQVALTRQMANEKKIGRVVFQRALDDGTIAKFLDSLAIIAVIESGRTELWLHDDQKAGQRVRGRTILAQLLKENLLAGCADVPNLQAIQAKGPAFYQKHFAGKVLVAWRGIQGDDVPYLVERGDEVILRWDHLDDDFDADCPAPSRK